MSFVVFDFETTRLYHKPGSYCPASFVTEAAAKACVTRLKKKYPNRDYDWAESDFYKNEIEKFVVRTNLMSGKEYTESINTPMHSSPASETYWSM